MTQENELSTFLQEQIDRNTKATKVTWIVGAIVVLLVTFYMSGLVYLVRGILEPMTAARMIGQSIEENMPPVLGGLEKTLEQQAIPVANALSEKLISSIPLLGEDARRKIDLTYEQFLPLLREEVRTTLRSYMEEHKEEIADLYETHRGPEFVNLFIHALVAEMTEYLNEKLSENASGLDIEYVSVSFLNALNNINDDLSRLLNLKTENMTRSEILQRRLIVIWSHSLEQLLRSKRSGEYPE